MYLREPARELNESNVVSTVLGAFQRNNAAKALIFMPGATDEFYFFHRARATITNSLPTLLDAISALTNQTYVRATLQPPFLILHTAEDPLETIAVVEDQKTADKIKRKKFRKEVLYNDRDWNFMQPILSFYLDAKVLPAPGSHDMYHFFRHSFAGFDLNAWEALEATTLAGKTKFTVKKGKIIFEGDVRFLAKPPTPPNFLIPKDGSKK